MSDRVRRGVAAVLTGVVAAALLILAAPPATWGVSPSQNDTDPNVSLDITRLSPDVLHPTDSLVIDVAISNFDPTPVEGLILTVSVTDEPIVDRGLLDSWEAGELDLPSHEVARASVSVEGNLTSPGLAKAALFAPSGLLDLPAETSGVYGVTVSLERTSDSLDSVNTFATWLDIAPEPIPVVVIVLASGSPERVSTLLSTVDPYEVSFAVDPSMLPDGVDDALSNLDTYLLPAYNVDVASLARAGASGILDIALNRAREASPPSLVSAPWLAVVANLDQASYDLAADRGASALLSLPSYSSASPEVSGYEGDVPPGIALPEGSAATGPVLLLPDTGLSSALVGGMSGSATASARMTAETALLANTNTAGNPVLIVAGPSWMIESDHRSSTLTALVSSPWVDLAPLDTLLDMESVPAAALTTSVPSQTDIPVALITAAGTSLRGITALAQATSAPVEFAEPYVDSLLGLLSLDRRTDPITRDDAIEVAIEATDSVRNSVFLPGSSPLNLISKSGNVPVTVTNSLDVEVTVRVVLVARSPILRVEDRPELTLAPGSSQQVLVPVAAVSSGNVAVRVSLENLEGTRLTPVTEFSLRIHAQWGEVFTIVLAGFAFILLVAGIIRTIRRGRADTRQGPSDEPEMGA